MEANAQTPLSERKVMDKETPKPNQFTVVSETTLERILSLMVDIRSRIGQKESADESSRLDSSLRFASVVGEVRRTLELVDSLMKELRESDYMFVRLIEVRRRLSRILEENPQHDLNKPI
jgi:hypothetical protein